MEQPKLKSFEKKLIIDPSQYGLFIEKLLDEQHLFTVTWHYSRKQFVVKSFIFIKLTNVELQNDDGTLTITLQIFKNAPTLNIRQAYTPDIDQVFIDYEDDEFDDDDDWQLIDVALHDHMLYNHLSTSDMPDNPIELLDKLEVMLDIPDNKFTWLKTFED